MKRMQDSTERKLDISFMPLDLANIESIQTFADAYKRQGN